MRYPVKLAKKLNTVVKSAKDDMLLEVTCHCGVSSSVHAWIVGGSGHICDCGRKIQFVKGVGISSIKPVEG